MATVALVVRPSQEAAEALALRAAAWLASAGHRARLIQLGTDGRCLDDGEAGELAAVDLAGTDLVVSLGGDGTFLGLVPQAWAADVPMLGVNFGRLGYLMEVEPGDLVGALELFLAGRLVVEDRLVMAVSVRGHLAPVRTEDQAVTEGTNGAEVDGRTWIALNEMVAEKTVPGHTVHLATSIDGEPFLAYSADGVLVATSTGSTAYNLSAGGPALSPRLAALIVTPVAPHLALDRSVVLAGDQVVTVEVGSNRPAVLVIDGREVGRLSPGAEITCRAASRPLRLVSVDQRGLAGLLRSALALDQGP